MTKPATFNEMSFRQNHVASRIIIILLLLSAHLALIIYWPGFRSALTDTSPSLRSQLYWLLPPPVLPPDRQMPLPPVVPQFHSKWIPPADIHNTQPAPHAEAAPTASDTAPVADLLASPALPPDTPAINRDVRQISRDVEKEMRQLFPNRIPQELVIAKGSFREFQRAVAAAAVHGELTYQTYTMADGTLITKVTGSMGSYCASAPNPAGGATIIQREGRGMRVMTCPGSLSF